MKILFRIEDDFILATETCEITITGDIFDKPKKGNRYLVGILKNIAKLRGHTSAVCIDILEII